MIQLYIYGLVSPQYHAKFDDTWETLDYFRNQSEDPSAWQRKAGFTPGEAPKKLKGKQQNESEIEGSALRPQTLCTLGSATPLASEGVEVTLDDNEADTMFSEGEHDSSELPEEPEPVQALPGEPAMDEENEELPEVEDTSDLRRSRRTRRPTEKFQAYLDNRNSAFIAFEALEERNPLHTSAATDEIFAFAATGIQVFAGRSSDPDTMYMHEALKAHNAGKFLQAMADEIETHEKRGHWVLMKRDDLPAGTPVLPSVWAMKRKRRVATGEVYKHKARLNFGRHKQEKFVNFWQTYSPVVGWTTIRFFLILALINGWHTRQYDFVLAYPQADVEVPLFMDIPRGFKIPGKGRNKDYCLQVKKNLYGQRQAGRVWNKFLDKGLIAAGFEPSDVDPCLYFRGTTILMIYVDDCLVIDPKNPTLSKPTRTSRHKVST